MRQEELARDAAKLEERERKAHITVPKGLQHIFNDTVIVRVKDAEDLYNPYDPTPEEDRDLNEDVEAYILKQMKRLPKKSHITIHLFIPEATLTGERLKTIPASFTNYFRARAIDHLVRNNRRFLRWTLNLLSGIVFLTACLLVAHLLKIQAPNHPFYNVLSEGLSIIGWVALWEPASYLLFGWKTDLREQHTYMRLHGADISITATDVRTNTAPQNTPQHSGD